MSASDTPPPSATELLQDPLLRDAPTVAGFKVLDPAVLYAKVGQGGMGAVYRGRHFKLDLDVAVKCLRPALCAESPDFVKRFEREARLAASLGHQNIVRVLDVFERHGLHYLVMEFVAGESARQRVVRKGALGEQEALAIVAGAAAGLAEAHQRGIVHRDIKPDNVLISHEGRVKLADLGLAKAAAGSAGEQSLSLASGVMGTPQYMAPEQWETPDVGPAADVWALGATLWYLLVGRHALDGSNLAALARRAHSEDFPSLRLARPGLTEATCELVERCVARDPAQRFADARTLHKALAALVTIDEAALADGESALGGDDAVLVTPPTRQTLSAIRTALDAGGRGDDEARTVPSPGQTMRLPPPGSARAGAANARRRRWPWLLAALLAIGAGGAWAAGWFDNDTNWEEVERYAKARRLYWEAKDLLPKPDGLDAAIDKFEEVLSLWPDYEIAKEPLAQALDKRAERLQQSDVDGAFVASKRAHELLAEDARIRERHQALETQLRQRLFAGFELAVYEALSGAASQLVVAEPAGELRGRVDAPGFAELQVRWLPRDEAAEAKWIPVAVVASDFTITAPTAPGDHSLEVMLRDRSGVSGVATRRVRVAGLQGQGPPGTRTPPGTSPVAELCTGAGQRMLPMAAHAFRMGSMNLSADHRADEAQHEVQLLEPFWIGATEVTRAEWLRLMGEAPWPGDGVAVPFAGDLPASHVEHTAAQRYCELLTERERAAERLPEGYRYCLPTEAQWEFASRGGSNADFGAGVDEARLGEWAVFGGDAPQRVGGRKANAFGLHDVFGNVAEWCADFAMPAIDGSGLVTATYVDGIAEPLSVIGSLRVHRGGSFASPAADCRAAARAAAAPDLRSAQIGFRVVLAKR
ncbi:MAG: bifunctional serine/threonine-protein kinase/formylglycine-generating enzyme family protein [Planctomycetota bacterium]